MTKKSNYEKLMTSLPPCYYTVASSPGHSRFYLAAVEKNRETAWDHCYVTDRKWWTRLVRSVDSVCTNRVHHFRSMT